MGEAPAGRRLQVEIVGVLRMMEGGEGLGCRGKALARGKGRVDPFRQLRHARDRRLDRLAQGARRQAGGQPVDRLDQRHRFRFRRLHHEIRMHHRGTAVEPVDLAADDHLFVHRQALLQPVALGAEEGERQFAGVVVQEHPVGDVGSSPRRRLVAVDTAGHGDDRPLRRMRDAWLVAAVDHAVWQVEDEIDDAAVLDALLAEQLGEQFTRLRADAGKRGEGGEQGIEQGRTHGSKMRRTIAAWQG